MMYRKRYQRAEQVSEKVDRQTLEKTLAAAEAQTARRAIQFPSLVAVLLLSWLMILSFARPSFAAGKKVKLSKTKLAMVQYEEKQLKLKNAQGTVKWKSSNKKIASVSSKGLVKSKKAGTCKITAKFNKKKYVCEVTVEPLMILSESLTLEKDISVALLLNNRSIEADWSSSNPGVATVDQDGIVETKGYGACTITAAYKGTKVACALKVTKMTPISLVLAGSSSMDLWRSTDNAGVNASESAFFPCKTINTARGGTYVTQWIQWVGGAHDRIVKYNPTAVVLYVGSNDLGNGAEGCVTGVKNAENTIVLLRKIRAALPKTVIFYVGVNPCWSREGAWNAIALSNSRMKQFCSSQANMHYIDIASAFRRPDGKPNDALFADKLHPNAAGYAIWKQVVVGEVKKVLEVE